MKNNKKKIKKNTANLQDEKTFDFIKDFIIFLMIFFGILIFICIFAFDI